MIDTPKCYVEPITILEQANTIILNNETFVSLGEFLVKVKLIEHVAYYETTTQNDVRVMVYEVSIEGVGIRYFSIPEPIFNVNQ